MTCNSTSTLAKIALTITLSTSAWLATSEHASNPATLYAAYAISSIPMLILFVYATRPFMRGMTSGAFKA